MQKKLALFDFLNFLRYRRRFIRLITDQLTDRTMLEKKSLLIVSGRGMNIVWANIWTLYALVVRSLGYAVYALTDPTQKSINRYFRLAKINLINLEDYCDFINSDFRVEIQELDDAGECLDRLRKITYKNVPIGEIVLSTYCRYHGTSIIDLRLKSTRAFIENWYIRNLKAVEVALVIFKKYKINKTFFSEVFMEEYGAFYFTALSCNIDVIKFSGTVRDNAVIIQHLNLLNARVHHSSLSEDSWRRLKLLSCSKKIDDAIDQNFKTRYGGNWKRSVRNQPSAKLATQSEFRSYFNISADRKVAVIYSHILYDTLYFHGTDLFSNYAEWLIETVRAASKNEEINWFVKVHPSNIWRQELNTLLKGKYEEERLLERFVGKLPPHVKVVSADCAISPISWINASDYGITVRGTSGLEMAALGKRVVTAGTGRYEGKGFTCDPKSKQEYLRVLTNLHQLPPLSEEEKALARLYAYGIFIGKPFELESFEPTLALGKTKVVGTDDLLYLPKPNRRLKFASDLNRFGEWFEDQAKFDLLNDLDKL